MNVELTSLCCPRCSGVLASAGAGERIHCSACHAEFPVWNGIPVLARDPDFYYGEMPKETFSRLLADAARGGTDRAIRGLVREGQIGEFALEYGICPSRGAFLGLLNPGPDRRVLDLGCGWGEISLALARVFGECCSLDLTKERVAFLRLRAQEQGIENLRVYCGGDDRLPFPSESFDCVVLNGVLEWVAEGSSGKPAGCQQRYLNEVARVLRPGGLVYLAIENRFALRYWLGMNEDHSQLPFVSLLPRPVADLVSYAARRRPYRTHTYSRRGYQRLLAGSGFGPARCFVPYPDYRRFEAILQPEDQADADNYFRGASGSRLKATAKAHLLPRMPHSFSIVAARGGEPPQHWFERFAEHLGKELGWPPGRSAVRIRVNSTGSLALRLSRGAQACLAKVPVGAISYQEVPWGYRVLERLQAEGGAAPLPFRFPRPLAAGVFEGVTYYASELLTPSASNSEPQDSRTTVLHRWLRWSAGHQRQLPRHDEGMEWEALRQSFARWGLPASASARGHYERLLTAAGDARVPCHGDLWSGNLIPCEGSYSIIDWDDYQERGLPLHDLFHYHLYRQHPQHWTQMLEYARHGFPETLLHPLRDSLRVVQAALPAEDWSPERLSAIFMLYVLQNVVRRTLRRSYPMDEALVQATALLEWECLPGVRALAATPLPSPRVLVPAAG